MGASVLRMRLPTSDRSAHGSVTSFFLMGPAVFEVLSQKRALFCLSSITDRGRLGASEKTTMLDRPENLGPPSQSRAAAAESVPTERSALEDNEFRVDDVPPGSALLVSEVVAVFNVAGTFYATQNECTHA